MAMIIKFLPGSRFKWSFSIRLFLALICIAINALAINIPNKPDSRVIDQTHTLSTQQQQILINTIDKIYATESHTEIQILMIPSLDNQPIEDVSLDVARTWKIGQKNINNGVFILVAVKDHKYRIEVGYGLEGVLPDGYIGNLERNIINPNFAKGDFFNGLNLAVLDMQKHIANDYKSPSATQAGVLSPQSAFIYVIIGVGVFVLIAMVGVATGKPGLIIEILWFIAKILTLFMLFRGGSRGDGNSSSNDDDIGGGGDFGGGGSSNKW